MRDMTAAGEPIGQYHSPDGSRRRVLSLACPHQRHGECLPVDQGDLEHGSIGDGVSLGRQALLRAVDAALIATCKDNAGDDLLAGFALINLTGDTGVGREQFPFADGDLIDFAFTDGTDGLSVQFRSFERARALVALAVEQVFSLPAVEGGGKFKADAGCILFCNINR